VSGHIIGAFKAFLLPFFFAIQTLTGQEIQAAARRDRSFASRQWTGASSSYHSGNSAYTDDVTGLEAQLLDITLNPADDPAVPLPEPEAVFIGKVTKQVSGK